MGRQNSIKKLIAGIALTCAAGATQAVEILFTEDSFFSGSGLSFAEVEIDTNRDVAVTKGFDLVENVAMTGTIANGVGNAGTETTVTFLETITNSSGVVPGTTGIDWTDFHVEFAFTGLGANDTWSVSNVGVDNGFSDVDAGNNITLEGDTVAAGDSFTLQFDLTVNFDNATSFSITEFPSTDAVSPTPMPEPTTLALLGLGLAGIGAKRKRRA